MWGIRSFAAQGLTSLILGVLSAGTAASNSRLQSTAVLPQMLAKQ